MGLGNDENSNQISLGMVGSVHSKNGTQVSWVAVLGSHGESLIAAQLHEAAKERP